MSGKPTVHLEIINPDDILVIGVNKWYRTFTTSSDRYPLKLKIPAGFVNDGWNLVTGDYTNIPLVGKNDSNVEYKVLIEGKEVVHVTYRSEVQPLAFNVTFRDTFSIKAREVDRGEQSGRRSSRFQDLMAFHAEAAPPTTAEDVPVLPDEGDEG